MSTIELGKNLGLKQTDSSEDNSDDGIATVPTAKGGMRRKHHRAWTLVEVIKLVEGVSKCGTGRWSEIKRLSFASYSYRTSVDLKVYFASHFVLSKYHVHVASKYAEKKKAKKKGIEIL